MKIKTQIGTIRTNGNLLLLEDVYKIATDNGHLALKPTEWLTKKDTIRFLGLLDRSEYQLKPNENYVSKTIVYLYTSFISDEIYDIILETFTECHTDNIDYIFLHDDDFLFNKMDDLEETIQDNEDILNNISEKLSSITNEKDAIEGEYYFCTVARHNEVVTEETAREASVRDLLAQLNDGIRVLSEMTQESIPTLLQEYPVSASMMEDVMEIEVPDEEEQM